MRDINSRPSRKAGLRRLWLVVSVLWLIFDLTVIAGRTSTINVILSGLLPIVGLYALAFSISWIVEGFRAGK
jgi:hypothetical protein